MFGISAVSIVFSTFVMYKEWIRWGGRCFRSCRRKRWDAVEIHTNSVEGLWLAAYLLKKQLVTHLNVVEYPAQWQNAYAVGEDLGTTETAINNVLYSTVTWEPIIKPMTALVQGHGDECFAVDLTNRKSFLHDLLEHTDDDDRVSAIKWVHTLDNAEDDDTPCPLPLQALSNRTTRRYFYNCYAPTMGWEALEATLRDHISRWGGTFSPNHDTICTTIDVRRKQENKDDQVNWVHDVDPVCPTLPYDILMDLQHVTETERRLSSVLHILQMDD